MRFLPVVERELRVAARKAVTHRSRFLSALTASFVIAGMVLIFQRNRPPAELGGSAFGILSFLLTWFCVIAGLLANFDSLSEEKRQGTIGLLFLTPLNDVDLILGKLASSTLMVVFGIMAVMPVLAITLAMGGVTQGEIWRLLVALLTVLIFSSAVALFVSSLQEDASKAFLYTLGFIVAWLAAIGIGNWIQHGLLESEIVPFGNFNPTGLPRLSREVSYAMAPDRFWISVACILSVSCLLLLTTTRITSNFRRHTFGDHRTSRKRSATAHSKPRYAEATGWNLASAAQQRGALLQSDPVVWLGTRNTDQPRLLRTVAIMATVVILGTLLVGGLAGGGVWIQPVIVIGFLVNLMLKLWIGVVACQAFNEMRNTGELELLLATPLRSNQIVTGQIESIKKVFERPVIWIVMAQTIPVILCLLLSVDEAGSVGGALLTMTCVLAVLFTDLRAIAWLGLWNGLAYGKMHVALGRTIFAVLVIPWLTLIVPCLGVILMLTWPIYSIVLGNIAQSRFRKRFPLIVSEPGVFKNGRPTPLAHKTARV